MNRLTKLATALSLSCTVVLVASCDRSAPTDLDPESDLSPSSDIPIVGEMLVGGPSDISSSLVAQVAPPGFTASPFAQAFIVTGAQRESPTIPGGGHLLPSNGDGTFGATTDIPGLVSVFGMDVADMDGDGDNDFLVCDTPGEVSQYTNDGSGTFSTAVIASGVGGVCTYLREGDFDENGTTDFVVGDLGVHSGIFVYLQTIPGAFTKVLPGLAWAPGGNSALGTAVGDVDGDGHQDVLVLGYFGIRSGEVRFYRGDGTGAMAPSTVLFDLGTDFGVTGPVGLALFDLEGDGDLDIVAGGGTGGDIGGGGTHFIYTNDGSGNFTAPSGFAFDLNAQTGVDAFDFDADGDHDLVATTFFTRSLYYIENLGGTLASPVFVDGLNGLSVGVGAPSLATVVVLNVDIDIKPGSDRNTINPKSKGVVPVAILGSEAFDATQIDRTTIAFGPDGAAPAHKAGGHLENVNGDAYMDLVSHYRQQETGLSPSNTEVCVTGQTLSGISFEGCDAVRVLNK